MKMATKKVTKIKKNTFMLNDKEYTAADFDVNMICDMQEIGFDPMEKPDKIIQFLRAYIALCMGIYDIRAAGKEISEHIKKGNNLDYVRDILIEKVNESGFFRQNSQTEEEDATEGEKQTEEATAETAEKAE